MANNNLYNYKTPKSGNEESSFFNIKGRINRKVFLLRWTFSVIIYIISYYFYFYIIGYFVEYDSREFIFFETIHFYVLPYLIIIFNIIQGVKRMHDVNKSGWYLMVPFYNLFLIFSQGTKGNNDYGIDPIPLKNIQFFDEIETPVQSANQISNDEEKKSGLDKWREHLNHIKKENPNKTYQEVLTIARNTYKPSKGNTRTSGLQGKKKKKATKNIMYTLTIFALLIVTAYYFIIYEPEHRDSDGDGIADVLDSCPFEYGKSTGLFTGCPDSDNDGVADISDDCPEKFGNEIDGCYYFKRVTFNNNSSNSAHLSIAYKYEDDWICKGWYSISSYSSRTIDLPKYFLSKELFWYARDENGAEWTGTYRYFYVERGGSSGFEVKNGRFIETGGGRAIKKGFYKLDLTDETTSLNLSD